MEYQLAWQPSIVQRRPRKSATIRWLYFRAIVREFRWTLLALAIAVTVSTCLYRFSPPGKDRDNSWGTCLYGGWMALVAQPLDMPPQQWYLKLMCGVYPVLGFVLLGEGVVRLSLLMISRRRGEKEWMLVVASTYRNHVILCGLGHLGFRVLEQLLKGGVDVVCIERDAESRMVTQAKALGVAVLIRDMTEDQALLDAGLANARAIIAATNNDIANLEVALDARKGNAKIRVLLRLYDQQLAAKISGALTLDAVFSSSSLAAPVVAELALGGKVIATSMLAGIQYLIIEVTLDAQSELVGKTVAELEGRYPVRLLAIAGRDGNTQSHPPFDAVLSGNDNLVLHAAADHLPNLSAAFDGGKNTV